MDWVPLEFRRKEVAYEILGKAKKVFNGTKLDFNDIVEDVFNEII
jgi:hypothetical protein